MEIVKEQFGDICTVGDLRAALADLPDDCPITCIIDEPVCVTVYEDTETNETYASIE
jgi:hypothetical protein